MFCPNCGHKLPDGSIYCDNCGSKIMVRADSSSGSGQQTGNPKKSAQAFDEQDYFAADLIERPAPKAASAEKKAAGTTGSAKSAKSSQTQVRKTASAKNVKASSSPKKSSSSYDWDDDEDTGSRAPLIIALIVAIIAIALIVVLFLRSGSFNLFNRNGSGNPAAPKTTSEATESLVFPTETPTPTATPTPTPKPTATPTPSATPTPTPTATPTPEPVNDDILKDSADRALTEADLTNLSEEQIRIARNEIFARHGYTFTNEELQNYFSAKSWYTPNPEFNASTEDLYDKMGLSETEISNIHFIEDYEKAHGLNESSR